jgi:hypothetical protein
MKNINVSSICCLVRRPFCFVELVLPNQIQSSVWEKEIDMIRSDRGDRKRGWWGVNGRWRAMHVLEQQADRHRRGSEPDAAAINPSIAVGKESPTRRAFSVLRAGRRARSPRLRPARRCALPQIRRDHA